MNGKSTLLATSLVTATLGFCAGYFFHPPGQLAPSPAPHAEIATGRVGEPAPSIELESPNKREQSEDSPPREALGSSSAARIISTDSELFSTVLLRHFDTEFARSWLEERSQAASETQRATSEEDFKTEVLALPALLGERAALRTNKTEVAVGALEVGDGALIVAACADETLVLDGAALSGELLDRVFQPRASGEALDGATLLNGKRAIPDGTLIEFGHGLYKLSDRKLRTEDGKFPTDLTITGAGINSTLVTLDTLRPRGEIKRLRIRDITLDCGNNYLFDLRGGALTIDLENVRIVRFDMGAGGSLVFYTGEGMLIRARDCEFIGGFGRSPSHGTLWRGPILVGSFTNCRFSLIDLLLDSRFKANVLFTDCTFENFFKDPTQESVGIFKGANILPLITWEERHQAETRSLAELFPTWTPR